MSGRRGRLFFSSRRAALPTALLSTVLSLAACGTDANMGVDASMPRDGALRDDGTRDAAPIDANRLDAAAVDAALPDAGTSGACPAGSDLLVLSLTGVTLAPVAGVPIDDGFAPGFGVVEGPVWARNALYVSHFGGGPTPASRIYRIDGAGVVSIAATDTGTNGLALDLAGRLVGARHSAGDVAVFDWADLAGPAAPLVSMYAGARFNSPNDLCFHSNGTLYFTDPGWQAPSTRTQPEDRAYVLTGSGAVSAIDGAPTRPNGIALSRDERTLYVTGTNGMRRFDLAADGTIAAGPFDVGAVSGGLDGLGRDCAGNLYVTGNDRVVVLDESLARVGELSATGATNVAFGGADQRTLYVTQLGTPPGLLSARMNVPGAAY